MIGCGGLQNHHIRAELKRCHIQPGDTVMIIQTRQGDRSTFKSTIRTSHPLHQIMVTVAAVTDPLRITFVFMDCLIV